MTPNIPFNTRDCRSDLIESFRNRIFEVAVPKVTHIKGDEEVVQPRRKFYPAEELRKIFTIGSVRQILSHDCHDCPKHLPDRHPARPDEYPEKVLQTDASLNLFALLVSLRHPLLICIFLAGYELSSLPLPRYFSTYDLNDRQFKHLPSRSREQLISNFEDLKWQFSVPTFTDGAFQNYQDRTILPFIDEQFIGRGGYGKVFKVWVHQSYCTLKTAQIAGTSSRNPGSMVFARKEIMDEDDIEFIREKTSLERIATLKDPHLVQIQKTYQLGDKFNILFPWATTNLFDYLRYNKWHAPRHSRLIKNPLWEQVLGITKALSKIINFTDPDDPEKVIFGYHLDLKPQNILIDNSAPGSRDVFKITDFGQAEFLNPAFGISSRISVTGGTDAYAPPEYLEREQDQSYDIWSLGIVVLEVLAYAIKDVAGLTHPETGLDNVRATTQHRQTDSRFYLISESGPIVKPVIRTWIDNLLRDPSIQDIENQKFARNLLEVIMLMLEPQKEKRMAIDTVAARMSEIFQMRSSGTAEVPAESYRLKDEVVLVDMKKVYYYPYGLQGRKSMQVSFIILENDQNELRTYIDRPAVPLKDKREQMELILSYQHIKDVESENYEISFAKSRHDYPVSMDGQSIVVENSTIARRLQMALLNHEISQRYQVAEMTFKEYKPPFVDAASKVVALASRTFRGSKDDNGGSINEPVVPLWAELWIQKPKAAAQAVPAKSQTNKSSSAPRRANRQTQPGQNAPLGRIVVYCKDRILMLPFRREYKIAKVENMERLQEQNVRFEPMDKRQCEFFYAFWLLPSDGPLPGIPMHFKKLEEAEAATSFKCQSIFLKFEKPKDAYAFYKLYKNEKTRWLEMKKGNPAPHPSLMGGI